MREKVHLLACAQVVFFAVSLVELLPGGFPWPCFCLVVPLGELSLGRVSAGRASRLGVVCAWAVPPEVVSPGVFLSEVVALEVPPGGGVWRLEEGVGRWNRPVCRLELAGLRAGSSFVAKKRKL